MTKTRYTADFRTRPAAPRAAGLRDTSGTPAASGNAAAAAVLPESHFDVVFENDRTMLKLKDRYAGLYTTGFISARGKDDSGTGGGGGSLLQEVWNSLSTNADAYRDTKIALGHIPALTVSKVTGLQDLLDAKADLASTLSGYGITDAYTSDEVDALLSAKSDTTHRHSAADITSGTLSIDRIPTIPYSKTSGVQATLVSGTSIKTINGVSILGSGNIVTPDTTYTSKDAASGGTDLSLVTTGEKYTWNAKQAAISDLSTIRSNAADGAAAYGWGDHSKAGYLKSIANLVINGTIYDGTNAVNITTPTYTLASFGITASAAELNYTKGVTSAIQTQLNAKADASALTNYLPLSGGRMSNTNVVTNLNADLLDGVHYQNILERVGSGSSATGTAGWYRIAETFVGAGSGVSFLLLLTRTFGNNNNESYVFSINMAYSGGISITQLSGHANTRLITKIRVDWKNDNNPEYIDIYIGSTTASNTYRWTTIGGAKSYTAWTADPALAGTAYEFATAEGCKSDRGFTGDITGTSTNASALNGLPYTSYLRKVTAANDAANDFDTFGSMTLTGRGDPKTGASVVNAPWSGAGPAGGYGVLTYLWNSSYGVQFAVGYHNHKVYIRDRYYNGSASVWNDTWSSLSLDGHTHSFASLTSKPTTLAGYGITDAPTKTGTGASGTWGINISGTAKALTPNSHTYEECPTIGDLKASLIANMNGGDVCYPVQSYNFTGSNVLTLKNNWATDSHAVGDGSRTSFLRLDRYMSASYGTFLMSGMSLDTKGGLYRLLLYDSKWYGPYLLLDEANYSSYALPLTGGTISGELTVAGNALRLGNSDAANLYMRRNQANYIWASAAGGWLCLGTVDGGVTSSDNSGINIKGKKVFVGGTLTGTAALNVAGVAYATTGIYSDGYVSARGVDSSSDGRLKTDVRPLTNALDYILGTRYHTFRWKSDGQPGIGVIAQEELGREHGYLVEKHNDFYSYNYAATTALLGAALQEEDDKVERLKARIAALEAELERLKYNS